jgi:aminoglycoside phosphotransferase (APT) family kinase protein
MRMPEAEVDITSDLVQKLIMDQHPDLSGPLTLIANGWDNVIFRLGEDLSVRLPRRQAAAQLVVNEQTWLPGLAPSLPVETPVPVRVGRPSADYPWSWTIGRWFDGMSLIELPVPDRSRVARSLAAFFAALHRPAPSDAPVNPVRGVPLRNRAALAEEHFATGLIPEPDRIAKLWSAALDTPAWGREPYWLHGDPHPANFLAGEQELSAVLDFGDITAGDPATDLASAWLTFDQQGRDIFTACYTELTEADPGIWQRARGWAIAIGMALVVNSDDNPQLAAVGRHALAAVLL